MRYGTERALDPGLKPRARLRYRLFGETHAGRLMRALWLIRTTGGEIRRDGLRILEVGSNTGSFVFWLARASRGSLIVGLERDASMVARSETLRRRLALSNVHFLSGDLQALPFRRCFDRIYCIDVLEHVADDDKALSELQALLVDGGSLILQYPPKVRRLHRWDHEGGHIGLGFTQEELLAKMRNAGFSVERVDRAAGVFGAAGYLIDVALSLYLHLPFLVKLPFVPLIIGLVRLDVVLTRRRRFGGYVLQAGPAGRESRGRGHG